MKIFWFIAVVLLQGVVSGSVLAEGAHMEVFRKKATYADMREALELAITGRGFVVNNVSHIGDMLARTGKDLGPGSKPVYLHAEAFEFCSATVSRRMMEADVDNIVFCPYIISVYEVPSKPGEVRIAFRKTQLVGDKASEDALKAVNDLLRDIAQDAIQ